MVIPKYSYITHFISYLVQTHFNTKNILSKYDDWMYERIMKGLSEVWIWAVAVYQLVMPYYTAYKLTLAYTGYKPTFAWIFIIRVFICYIHTGFKENPLKTTYFFRFLAISLYSRILLYY